MERTVRTLSSNSATHIVIARFLSSTTAADNSNEWVNAKPYSKIPGPKPLPIPKFGNFWRFLPFGTYGNMSFIEFQSKLFEDYGPIIKLTGIGKPDMVMVLDPNDAQQVYRTEGVWPTRRGGDVFDYYRRRVRRDIFGDYLGVASTQGEEWHKNRTILNPHMMKPQSVKNYHEPIQNVATDFIERMRTIKDANQEMPADFYNEMCKWSLESIAMIALDTRLGCLSPNLDANSDAQIMITSVSQVFDLMYKLDVLPSFWKYLSTPDYKLYIKNMDIVMGFCMKQIDKKLKKINEFHKTDSDGLSILETLLQAKDGKLIATTMAIDMLMAGIDTTSNTTAFLLYYLATHPVEQEKLYQELRKIMPKKGDHLPHDYLNSTPYLKACAKESQRVTPILIGHLRGTGADLVLKGYQIPKNTDVVMANLLMSRQEKYFKEALKWNPQRWLKGHDGSAAEAKNAHPFITIPFGFGPRMCIGRRFAELELHTLVSQMIRNFRLTYHYGELKVDSKLLLSPGIPLKFKIEERVD